VLESDRVVAHRVRDIDRRREQTPHAFFHVWLKETRVVIWEVLASLYHRAGSRKSNVYGKLGFNVS
jgi:hypothetical protein